jgi:hypothetical protein
VFSEKWRKVLDLLDGSVVMMPENLFACSK